MSTGMPECPRCAAVLRPGTLYCVSCGNRIGHRTGSDPAPAGGSNGVGMAQRDLKDAAAFRRLVAKLVDVLPSTVLSGVLTAVGASTIRTQQVSAVAQQVDLTGFLVFSGVGTLLSLAYAIFIWGWEARTGRTPGNLLLGIRTTDEQGHPAGWLAIFVRGLLVAVAGIIPVVGSVLMLISNVFDPHGKKQGWHDKAAHTRVFDVRAGRNPLETGGIGGPASFAPSEPAPGLQPIASPVPGARAAGAQEPAVQPAPGSAPASVPASVPAAVPASFRSDAPDDATSRPLPRVPQPAEHASTGSGMLLPGPVPLSEAPDRRRDTPPSAAPGVVSFAPAPSERAASVPAASAPAARVPAPAAHPDDDVEQTRVTTGRAPGPLKILFDNGREVELRSHALIGRNPAGQNGEMIDQLIDFSDQGRSVSKTHLHVRVEGQGLWVSDRNSTNGSAITAPDGQRTPVRAGETLLAQPGSTVHFGDRSFLVVRP
jgi:uncharacterized RDD family membrane protein YckC